MPPSGRRGRAAPRRRWPGQRWVRPAPRMGWPGSFPIRWRPTPTPAPTRPRTSRSSSGSTGWSGGRSSVEPPARESAGPRPTPCGSWRSWCARSGWRTSVPWPRPKPGAWCRSRGGWPTRSPRWRPSGWRRETSPSWSGSSLPSRQGGCASSRRRRPRPRRSRVRRWSGRSTIRRRGTPRSEDRWTSGSKLRGPQPRSPPRRSRRSGARSPIQPAWPLLPARPRPRGFRCRAS